MVSNGTAQEQEYQVKMAKTLLDLPAEIRLKICKEYLKAVGKKCKIGDTRAVNPWVDLMLVNRQCNNDLMAALEGTKHGVLSIALTHILDRCDGRLTEFFLEHIPQIADLTGNTRRWSGIRFNILDAKRNWVVDRYDWLCKVDRINGRLLSSSDGPSRMHGGRWCQLADDEYEWVKELLGVRSAT